MIGEYNFQVIDASQSVHKQQKLIRQHVQNMLKGWEVLPLPSLSANSARKKIASEKPR